MWLPTNHPAASSLPRLPRLWEAGSASCIRFAIAPVHLTDARLSLRSALASRGPLIPFCPAAEAPPPHVHCVTRASNRTVPSGAAASHSIIADRPTSLPSGPNQAAYPLTRLAAAAADLPWGCQPLAQPHRRSFSAAADPQTPKQDAEGASTSGEKPAEARDGP